MPLVWTRNDREVYLLTPHMIIPSDGSVWLYRMHSGNMRSPQCRQTRIPPSWCYKQNRGFSNDTPIVCLGPLGNKTLKAFLSVKQGQWYPKPWCQTNRLCCYKYRRTVRAKTSLANSFILWLRARDGVVRSLKFIRVRCFFFPWLLTIACHKVFCIIFLTRQLHILQIVMGSPFTWATILRHHKLRFQWATIQPLFKSDTCC